jgi:hypothetical protein
MKQLLLAVLLLVPGLARAQGQLPIPPDCILNFFTNTITGSATVVSGVFDNRTTACQTWTVDYQASNTGGTISALSLTFQSANGAISAGTFGTYAGATESGSNPATSTIGSVSTFSNGTTVISWVRMSLTLTATGTTTVKGILYGYKTGYPGGGGGGGGGGNTPTIFSTPLYQAQDALSLSGGTETLTVQQVALASAKHNAIFQSAWVTFSAAATFVLSQNCTAATATAGTIMRLNNSPASTVTAFTASNVGTSGCFQSTTYQLPSQGTYVLNLSDLFLSQTGGTGQNLSIAVTGTGTGSITIQFAEN